MKLLIKNFLRVWYFRLLSTLLILGLLTIFLTEASFNTKVLIDNSIKVKKILEEQRVSYVITTVLMSEEMVLSEEED